MLPLYLVVVHYPLCHSFVQHLLVPFLKAFGLWDLLICGVTVEDVVVPFTGRAGPDVAGGVAAEDTDRTWKMSMIHLQTSKSKLCDWKELETKIKAFLVQEHSPQLLDVFQVPDEDFMVNCCSERARPKEVHTVQVGDVNSPEWVKEEIMKISQLLELDLKFQD